MDSYLMMLYVTLEQETALKAFFLQHGWAFCKPDLGVFTDKVGPTLHKSVTPQPALETQIEVNKKRKGDAPCKPPVVKLLKIYPSCPRTGWDSSRLNLAQILTAKNEHMKRCKPDSSLSCESLSADCGKDDTAVNIKEGEDKFVDFDDGDSDADDDCADQDETIQDKDGDLEKVKILDTWLKQSVVGTPPGKERFKCCICEQSTKNKSNMKRHLNIHLPNKINCSICNRFFDTDKEKEDHMVNRHATGFKCDQCNVTFKRRSELNSHLFRHKAETDSDTPGCFRCPYDCCKKIFFRKSNYDFHLNSHVGKKPFACSECNKPFSSAWSRNVHEKVCVNQTEFICDICNKVFKQKSGLYNHKQAEHVRTEKGYNCTICPCVFKYNTGLLRHIKEKHKTLEAGQQTEGGVEKHSVKDSKTPVTEPIEQTPVSNFKDAKDFRDELNKVADGASLGNAVKPAMVSAGGLNIHGIRAISSQVSGIASITSVTSASDLSLHTAGINFLTTDIGGSFGLNTHTHSGVTASTPSSLYTVAHTGQVFGTNTSMIVTSSSSADQT